MPQYDELRPLFNKYEQNRRQSHAKYMRLPPFFAAGLKSFLGCPDVFSYNGRQKEFVSPVSTEWDNNRGDFIFDLTKPYSVEYRDDFRCYFGICIYLERAPNAFPKTAYIVILSALLNGDDIEIRWEDSKTKPVIRLERIGQDVDPQKEAEKLYEQIFEGMKEALSGDPNKPHIGFIDFDRSIT